MNIKNVLILLPAMTGFLVLIGWLFQIEALVRVKSSWASMKPITAFSFILLSLIFVTFKLNQKNPSELRHRLKGFFGILLLTLLSLQYLVKLDLGFGSISQIGPIEIDAIALKWRMSPITHTCFLFLISSIFFRSLKRQKKWVIAADATAFLSGLTSVAVFFGYLLGIDQIYKYSPEASIALHTTILFVTSSINTLFLRTDEGFAKFFLSPHVGGSLARSLMPSILFFGTLIVWFRWKGQQAGYYGTEVGILILLMGFTVLMIFSLWASLDKLNKMEISRAAIETERLRLFEIPCHLLCIVDERACFKNVNQGFTEILGYTQNDLLGKSVWDLIHPDDFAKSAIKEQREHLTIFHSIENRYRRKDGSYRWLRWTGTIIEGMNYCAAIDITIEKQKEEELQKTLFAIKQLSFRLNQAQEEERSRISREIHDELGQSLTVLKMEIFSFKKRFPENSIEKEKFRQILKSIDSLINSVRSIAAEMRPASLDDLGLVAAADWWLEGVQSRTGITIDSTIDFSQDEISMEQQTAIFRILQESVTNAIRHSKSDKITVTIKKENGLFTLMVRDFGVGFITPHEDNHKSCGIEGMKERLRPYFGRLTVQNAAGGGTLVTAKLPLTHGVEL